MTPCSAPCGGLFLRRFSSLIAIFLASSENALASIFFSSSAMSSSSSSSPVMGDPDPLEAGKRLRRGVAGTPFG
jgi:hypothetical protein